jgi:hypothetical protein
VNIEEKVWLLVKKILTWKVTHFAWFGEPWQHAFFQTLTWTLNNKIECFLLLLLLLRHPERSRVTYCYSTLLFHYYYYYSYYYSSTHICPLDFSEMPLSNFIDLFGLSRSTSCGCCSYQVASISVRRVTCYDHFCVFQFFCILVVSMATAAILSNFMKLCRNIHCSVWQLLEGWIHSKWRPLPW